MVRTIRRMSLEYKVLNTNNHTTVPCVNTNNQSYLTVGTPHKINRNKIIMLKCYLIIQQNNKIIGKFL